MYRIIITSGGTREPIDDVRAITNGSTGTLGSKIADRFLSDFESEISELVYIHGIGAKIPSVKSMKLRKVEIESALDLLETLKLEMNKKTDIVIQAMAVSDYRVDSILKKHEDGFVKIDNQKKISSEIEEMAVVLKKNPKVISEIKKISPGTALVGFKLLSHVAREELFRVALEIGTKNDCDFVFANDLRDIDGNKHIGFLMDREGNHMEYHSKDEIAQGISQECMNLLRRKNEGK